MAVERLTPQKRHQTRGEEIANAASHGVGLLAAVAAVPFLVLAAVGRGSAAVIVGACVFGATVIALYGLSTLYHAWPGEHGKRRLRMLDHLAIYFLIAGTYTPFMLGALRGPWGWSLLGVVWGLALLGIVLKSAGTLRFPWVSTGLYLLMGWVIVIAVRPLLQHVPAWGLFWIIAGGVAYTGGVVFYATDARFRYGHFVWHLFVLAGTACHFVAVMGYSA